VNAKRGGSTSLLVIALPDDGSNYRPKHVAVNGLNIKSFMVLY